MLRAKYGEDYFKGQAAPEHTQEEAFAMYEAGVAAAATQGKRVVLVDGQPRDTEQVRRVFDRILKERENGLCHVFVFVDASEETRRARATETRTGASLELAKQRLTNDYRNAYVTMMPILQEYPCRVAMLSTENSASSSMQFVNYDRLIDYLLYWKSRTGCACCYGVRGTNYWPRTKKHTITML